MLYFITFFIYTLILFCICFVTSLWPCNLFWPTNLLPHASALLWSTRGLCVPFKETPFKPLIWQGLARVQNWLVSHQRAFSSIRNQSRTSWVWTQANTTSFQLQITRKLFEAWLQNCSKKGPGKEAAMNEAQAASCWLISNAQKLYQFLKFALAALEEILGQKAKNCLILQLASSCYLPTFPFWQALVLEKQQRQQRLVFLVEHSLGVVN